MEIEGSAREIIDIKNNLQLLQTDRLMQTLNSSQMQKVRKVCKG